MKEIEKRIDINKLILILLIVFMLLPASYSFFPVSIFKVETIFIGIICIGMLFKRKKEFLEQMNKNSFLKMNILFAIILEISYIVNIDTFMFNDIFDTIKYIVYAMVTIFVICICQERKYYIFVLKMICIIMIFLGIFGVIQYFNFFSINELYIKSYASTQYETLVNNYPTPRIVGVKSNPNVYGILMVLGIYFNFIYYKFSKNKFLSSLSVALCVINLMMTLTRTVQIAFLFSIFLYIVLKILFKFGWKQSCKAALIVFVIICVLICFLPKSLTWRLLQVFDLKNANSWLLRVEKWRKYFDIIKTNILFGVGGIKNYKQYFASIDSELVQMLLQYGMIGIVIYFALLISPLYIAFKSKKEKRQYILQFYLPVLSVILINNIAASTLINYETAIGIYLIIGIILVEIRDGEMKKITNKNIIFNTVLPLWSMDNKSGGKALYSTVETYLNNGYNVFWVTDRKNNYEESNLKLKKENIFYIDTNWRDKILEKKFFNKWGIRKIINWIYCKKYEMQSFRIMDKIIKQNGEAVIYAYEVHAVKSCKKISIIYNLPLITRFQGTVMAGKKDNLYNRLNKYPHIQALSTLSDLVIMTDDGTMGDKVLKEYKNESKTLFIRNGVNILSMGEIPSVNKNHLRKELGISEDKTILLTVSRLVDWKKVDRSINALKVLKNKENYYLIIIGEGAERSRLEELVKKLELTNQVKFMGAVKNEEVYKYMQLTDIFLSFYDLSNVGNPLLEALSLGKPIITYNVGDTNKVITNEQNGILLDDVSPESIANMIEKMNHKESLEYYSNSAKEYTKNNLYSWEKRMQIELKEVEKLIK